MRKPIKLHVCLSRCFRLAALSVLGFGIVTVAAPEKAASSELFLTLQREKQALQQQLAESQEAVQRRGAEIKALQAGLDAAEARAATAVDQRDAAADRVAELTAKLARSERRQRELAAAATAEVDRAKAYAAALSELKDLLTRQQDAVSAQREQVETVETRNQRLQAAAAAASAAKQVAMSEVEKLTTQVQTERAALTAERVDMHYNLAVIFTKNRLFGDAEREYRKCLDANPDDADVHYNLGILYEEHLKDDLRALKHYEKFVRLRPGSPETPQVKRWIDALVDR